uniref:Carbonic anhydrase n=1 Tax=Hemiselmis tepida TaxID=464990 RepID=A0A7S0YXJ7_9CRYP|mmetsp:Transcript_28558/g.72332  ORF Transcript_28558/g.72332 Transcript_28558/m.72332 type:complete len:345 (+) Transcript_28558:41-1075(+)
MLISVIIATALAVANADGPGSWNYDRCDVANGPVYWADLCMGTEQSPINLCGAVNLPISAAITMTNYEKEIKADLMRDGGVKFTVDGGDALTTSVGQVPQFLGRSTPDVTEDIVWNLEQAHFHWGRTDVNEEGSEHYMENFQYPLEIHFVHYNSKYKDVTEAVTSGNSDALLVIGTMYRLQEDAAVGETESPALTALGNGIDAQRRQGKENQELSLTPSQLIDTSGGFYTYAGSLTTPTCNPVVTWINLAKPMPVTPSTLRKFQDVRAGDKTIADHGNYRNLMPLGTRILYKSGDDVVSYPCPNRGVVEPAWEGCSASGAPSLSAGLLAPAAAALAALAAALRL